jgi:uncharacterized protein YecE (DUF72 family)
VWVDSGTVDVRLDNPDLQRDRIVVFKLQCLVGIMCETRVGVSGWRYAPWRGRFYPSTLPQRLELSFASTCLNSIEINGSFYSLQRPESYAQWYSATPVDFVFAVKGSRFITHMKRLKNVEQAQANFWASGILRLEEKLGPILWQLPPNFQFDDSTLNRFFDQLPRSTLEAARIARHHGDFLKDRCWLTVQKDRRLRHAIEIRHESFMTEAFVKLLRRQKIALVIADTAKKWPYMEDMTTNFVYARLHGDKEIYVSGYNSKALKCWADRFTKWRNGSEPEDAKRHASKARPLARRDVYIYFDNDVKVHAPFNALDLARRLGACSVCGSGNRKPC